MSLALILPGRSRPVVKHSVSTAVSLTLSILVLLFFSAATPAFAQHPGSGHGGGGGHAGGSGVGAGGGHAGSGAHVGGGGLAGSGAGGHVGSGGGHPSVAGVGATSFRGGEPSGGMRSGAVSGSVSAPSSHAGAPVYSQHYYYAPPPAPAGSPNMGRAARANLMPAVSPQRAGQRPPASLSVSEPSHIVWQAPSRSLALPTAVARRAPVAAPAPVQRPPFAGSFPAVPKFPGVFVPRGASMASRTALPAGMIPRAPLRGVGMRPFPFGPPFFVNPGFFFGFSSGFGRNAFFGGFGFPFFTPTSCFFNGFSNVCFAQPFTPVFFSPASFSPFCPFGFNRFGLGAFGTFSASHDMNFSDNSTVASEPAPESRDWGPYSYQPAPESSSEQVQPATQSAQASEFEGQGSTLTEHAQAAEPLAMIFLNDGTNYQVSDYWLEGGRLHYVTSYGGENSIAIDGLDLQRTVDENWKNGVQFILRPSR